MGLSAIELSAKFVILEFIRIGVELSIDIFRGIEAQFWIDPIKIGSILSITAAEVNEKGPNFSLKILPFQNVYELKISGMFKFLGLKVLSFLELSKMGIVFKLEAGFHLGSLIGMEAGVNVILKRGEEFYFKSYFNFYLNIETPEISIFGLEIGKMRLFGVELRAEIEFKQLRLKIQGKIAVVIFGVNLSIEIDMEIDMCEFQKITGEIVKWIRQNWKESLLKLGKFIVKELWNAFCKVGEAICLMFTDPIKFITDLFSMKFSLSSGNGGNGESGDSNNQDQGKQIKENGKAGNSKNQGKQINVKAAKKLIEACAQQCIINGNYDDAFVLHDACDSCDKPSEKLKGYCRKLNSEELLERVTDCKDPWKKISYLHQLSKITEEESLAETFQDEKQRNLDEVKTEQKYMRGKNRKVDLNLRDVCEKFKNYKG